MSGRFQLQSPYLVKLCNMSCCIVIFAGRPLVSEGMTDPDNLFNLFDVRIAAVDVVTNSGDGGEKGLVGGDIIGEWNGVSGSAERR